MFLKGLGPIATIPLIVIILKWFNILDKIPYINTFEFNSLILWAAIINISLFELKRNKKHP